MTRTTEHKHLVRLRRFLADHFSTEELRTLCFDLGIQYENLPDRLDGMSRELVELCERRGFIPELERAIKERHSSVPWIDRTVTAEEALSSRVRHHELPPPPADFTGRKDELTELATAFFEDGACIFGLQGMGGAGKTALALKLAEQLAPFFPDAQFFLDLRGTSPAPLPNAKVMTRIIHAYHPGIVVPHEENELSGLYRSVLYGKRVLLFADDAADATQVAPLIPPVGCALIVTSRTRFSLPGIRSLVLDQLPPDDACAFLLSIAPRINAYADKMADLCGYLPLALRLAASHLAERADLNPAAYSRRLQEARTRLDLVAAPFSLSFDALEAEQRRLWCMLSVLPYGFSPVSAAAVWNMDLDTAQETLSDLVQYSLVQWNEHEYHLHDLLRLFAEVQLCDADRFAAQDRSRTYWQRFDLVVEEALRKAQLKGYLTVDDVLELFPNGESQLDAIEELFLRLGSSSIEVYDDLSDTL